MLGSDYNDQVCSVARSLEVIGERWTLLIMRDVFLGRNRFDALVESLGVTRTVLTKRLGHLVTEGVLVKRAYQERPERFEYLPTAKGRELYPIIALLTMWGDRHYPDPAGPPRLLLHRGCGGALTARFLCDRCGRALEPDDVESQPGPALTAATAAQ
jgi:DNA-binding HxlR family transcriptional regulator